MFLLTYVIPERIIFVSRGITVLYCHPLAWLPIPHFSTLAHKQHDFQGEIYWTKSVCFDFLCIFCTQHLTLRRTQRDKVTNVRRSPCQVPYSRQILMKLELSWQNFKKSSDINFYNNPFSGGQFVLGGQTDRQTDRQTDTHDEVNSHLS
jgi:hypothetical protein